ncbi:MAG: endolytic transglycosylase MltG, partial [Oscillospiraceae bacterium]|nr:endolytic transglycosylase MltG [Oscillospiraceae bacterium]
VTIPEGYTVDDIITLLVDKHGCGTREGFIDVIQNGQFDYWFIDELENLNPNRKYRLEGYLYPDTYYFYKEGEEYDVINKMLSNFNRKFTIEYKQECEKAGMKVDDVVNLASIVQMEAKYSTDYAMVSQVIHNRLNSAYYNYRLECDATIQYALEERKEDLTHDDTLIDHPYNSYKNGGLPPGPISNPTLKAIRAALYPEYTAQPYYFFISDIDGYMLYGKNYPEHQANIAKVEANAAAAKAAAGN